MPLIIRDPSGDASGARGARIEALSESIDIMPTVLDWHGLAVPPQCDGASLLPFCRGNEPEDWRTEAHSQLDFRNALDGGGRRVANLGADQCSLSILRGQRFKYIHFTALPPLLFDLEDDPHEFHNLEQDASYRDVLLDSAQKLLSWRMTYEQRILASAPQ